MKCVKAAKKEAETVKQKLIKLKALSKTHRPCVSEQYIYFPLSEEVKGFTIVNKKCEELPKQEIDISSFDQIGDIVIVAEDVEKKTADEILKNRSIKTVLRKKGIHHGEFRTQDLEVLAGEKRKETIYRENGVKMKLDVEKVYFSPRLSTERRRVADLVKDNEKVLVLFSGVAPYPLTIAKHSKAKLIVAVEKNPLGHKYAMENCKKYPNIALLNLDAKDFNYEEKFDRVLMPLPKSAEDFLDIALKHLKKGGTIHFYDFIHESEIPNTSIKKIEKHIKNFKLLQVTKCGKFAPGKYRICLDIQV